MILLAMMSVLSSAEAGSSPYMWGVGPTVSTIVYPGEHPMGFPKATRDDDHEVDEDGEPLLKKSRGDVGIGAHGVLYMSKAQRVGSHIWTALGAGGFRSTNFTLEYDFAGTESGGVGVLGGLGVGVGTQRWQTGGAGELKMTTYLGRAQGSVIYRTRRQAYEIAGFFHLCLPGKQRWNASGDPPEEEVTGGFYPHLGIEATAYFGDFTAPKSKKKKKKKKKR